MIRLGACHGIPLSVAGTTGRGRVLRRLDAPCEGKAVPAPSLIYKEK